jgi:hypothetical protein
MRTIRVFVVLSLTMFSSGAGATCSAPDSFILSDFKTYAQNTSSWCWVASGQITINSIEDGSVPSQCDAVSKRVNGEDGEIDCCASDTPDECLVTSDLPPFAEYGFSFKKTSGNLNLPAEDRSLSWSQIKRQIYCNNKPFAFSWRWTASDYESGHMMVAVGYKEEGGERFVYFFDPWPPKKGPVGKANRLKVVTYDEYIEDTDHIHGQAFYDISR